MDSNPGSLVPKATALPTAPQQLPWQNTFKIASLRKLKTLNKHLKGPKLKRK